MKSKIKLLLLKDVEDLGRSGEVASAKPGYARNYLVPYKFAVVATPNTLKMQEKLQKERAIKAVEEKKEAEELAKTLESITLSTTVKVDPEGKMYGSVTQQDIVNLLSQQNVVLSKKNIDMKKPIKEVGTFDIPLKLKENVQAKVSLQVIPEKIHMPKEEEKKRKKTEEEEAKKDEKKAKEKKPKAKKPKEEKENNK